MSQKKTCVGSQSNHGLGPNSHWEVEVDVYLEAATDPPQFSIETSMPVNEDGEIVFKNRGRHGFVILFNLHDLTGQGYYFPGPPDLKEALWSAEGAGCPACAGQWSQFSTIRVTNKNMTLVVRNLNDTVTQFGYILRVTKDDNNYLALDPGGDNQNGFFAYQYQ